MSVRRLKSALLLVAAAIAAPLAAADEPAALAHDPFSRPPSQIAAGGVGPVDAAAPGGWAYALRATLVGARTRYANVDGRILALGESVDGFELVEVGEDSAVFARDGERVTVFVRPSPEDIADD